LQSKKGDGKVCFACRMKNEQVELSFSKLVNRDFLAISSSLQKKFIFKKLPSTNID